MRMFPSQPHETKSNAERRVFDQLRSALSGPDQHDWFALHSLNLPRHAYKRFGEIDFVVCGPGGLFVLEVKGGGLSCREGVWETTNRYGETDRLKESPFKQAETALHGLRRKLPEPLQSRLIVGFGVVAPDVRGFPPSVEWDREQLADASDFHRFEKWLLALVAYWRKKDGSKRSLDPGTLSELLKALRPDFETVVPLHAQAHAVEQRIATFTSEQMRLIDVVEANERVICHGGAGTGKTLLALELARRWVAAGLRVALACHSPWLRGFLDRQAMPGLSVCLADSIAIAARRAGLERFDALIVDEGQDVLNMESLAKLDAALRGGLETGRWCFFHDANNQSGLCGSYVPDAYDYLASLSPTKVPLRTNCRNTLQILNKVKGSLGADLGVSGVGEGPAVREQIARDAEHAAALLAAELDALIENEGFSPAEIVVLSPLPLAQSSAAPLVDRRKPVLAEMDAYSPRAGGRALPGFAMVGDFKGLESEVVVLIDMPTPGRDSVFSAQHYVGMSRARVLLSIISVDMN